MAGDYEVYQAHAHWQGGSVAWHRHDQYREALHGLLLRPETICLGIDQFYGAAADADYLEAMQEFIPSSAVGTRGAPRQSGLRCRSRCLPFTQAQCLPIRE